MKNLINFKRLLPISVASSFLLTYSLPTFAAVLNLSTSTAPMHHAGSHAAPVAANFGGSRRLGAGVTPLANLNLSSSTASMHTGGQATPVTINVGGASLMFGAGSALTPAEFMAVQQVLHTGTQQLGLDASGRAVSGRVLFNAVTAGGLSSLVVPHGVTAIMNFAHTSGLMNLTGDLVNSGNFYALSTQSAMHNATISASNIVNNSGALLTSVVPAIGLPGYSNAIKDLSLTLNASNKVFNAGTISSAGKLNVAVGGGITNTSGAVLQSVGDLNLKTNSLVNSGLVQSLNANVNIATTTGDITVQGTSGTIMAANAINVGNFANTSSILLNGGNWLSSQLNLNTSGMLNARLGEVTGIVNVHSNGAHISADTPNLQFGNVCVNGDPYFLSTGDLTITSTMVAATDGYPLLLVAGHNINATDPSALDIDTSSQHPYGGGDVTMIAGADYTEDPNPQDLSTPGQGYYTAVTVNGQSLLGGSINLYDRTGVGGSAGLRNIDTHGYGASNPNSGNVTLVAYSGLDPNSGNVLLRQDGIINTAAVGSGSNGNVLVMAGSLAQNASPQIQLPIINAAGGNGTGGSVQIVSCAVNTVNAGTVVFNGDGQLVSNAYTPQMTRTSAGDNWTPLNGNMNLMAIHGAGSNAPDIVTKGFIVIDGSSDPSGQALTWAPAASEIAQSANANFNMQRDNASTLIASQILITGDVLLPDSHLIVKTTAGGVVFNGTSAYAGAIDINALNSGGVGGTSNLGAGYGFVNGGAYVDDPHNAGKSMFSGNITINAGGAITVPSIAAISGDIKLAASSIGSSSNLVRVAAGNVPDSTQLSGFRPATVAVNTTGDTYITSDTTLVLDMTSSSVGVNATLSASTTNGADLVLQGVPLFGIGTPLQAHDFNFSSGGNISVENFVFVIADTVELSAANGSIQEEGFLSSPLNVDAGSISASATGSIHLVSFDLPASANFPHYGALSPNTVLHNISVGDSSTFKYEPGALFNGVPVTVDLSGATIGTAATLDVTADNTLTVTGAITGGDGSIVKLTTTTNSILVNAPINMGLGGSVTLKSAKDIAIQNNASILFAGGGLISLTAAQAITANQGSSLGAGSVGMQAGADIGSSAHPVTTQTGDLSIYNGQNVFVHNLIYSMTFGTGSVLTLNLVGDSDININGGLNAVNANVSSTSGSITIGGANLSAGSAANLPAPSLKLSASAPLGKVTISDFVSSDGPITIQSSTVINNSTITGNQLIVVNSNPGAQLNISGTGKYIADTVNFTASPSSVLDSNKIDVNGSLTVQGTTNFIQNADQTSRITFEPNSSFTSTGPITTYATQDILAGGINAPVVKLSMPDGVGIIANPYPFDLVLPKNITVVGHNLTILSVANIVAPSLTTSINLSNTKGQGGSLTMIAGYNFHTNSPTISHLTIGGLQTDLGNLYTIDGPSSMGGSVLLPSVAINTSSGATFSNSGIAGNVTVVAHSGTTNSGVVYLGSITAKGSPSAGKGDNVTLIGPGGVATGAIDTSGAFAGNVSAVAAQPQILGGPMIFQDGYNRSGAIFVPGALSTNGAAVILAGVNTSATAGQAGSITLKTDGPITVVSSITAKGLNSYTPFSQSSGAGPAGGIINISSTNDTVLLKGNVDASGQDFKSTTVKHDGGAGGKINISSPNAIELMLSAFANGGNSTTIPGNGGKAGSILLTSSRLDSNNGPLAQVIVHGVVDAIGGDGQIGGNGGGVFLSGEQVQVWGKQLVTNFTGNISIDAAPGVSKTSTAGQIGSVLIATNAVQTVPTNLNLAEPLSHTNPGDIGIPGGLFSVALAGVSTPDNGSVGAIVTGIVPKGFTTANFPGVKSGLLTSTSTQTSHNVIVVVHGGTQTIKEWDSSSNQMVFTPIAADVKVSPAEAAALYEVTHGMTQTIFPDANTGVATDRDHNGTPGGHGFITFNADDIRLPFSSFNLAPTSSTHINVVVNGAQPQIDLSSAKLLNIAGLLQFDTGSNATIYFGKFTTPLSATGSISGSDKLNILTDAVSFNNLGQMYSNSFYLVPSSALPFTFDNKPGAIFQSLNTGGSTPALNIPAVGALPVMTFKNEGGQFNYFSNSSFLPMPVNFSTDTVSLGNGTVALHTLPLNVTRNVNLTFALEQTSGATRVSQPALVGGTTSAHSVSIKTIVMADKNASDLTLSAGSSIESFTTASVNSAGSLTLSGTLESDDGALTAGATSNVTTTAAAYISACSNLTIIAIKGAAILNGNLINNTNHFVVSSPSVIQVFGNLQSGQFYGNTSTPGTLDKTGSGQFGDLKLQTTSATASILIGSGAQLTSNGVTGKSGDVTLDSKSCVIGSGNFTLTAFGGNVNVYADSFINFGSNQGSNPTISAYALGDNNKPTTTTSVGGNVSMASGLAVTPLHVPTALVPGNPSTLSPSHSSSISVTQQGGAIVVQGTAGLVDLATSGTHTTHLTQQGGTISLNGLADAAHLTAPTGQIHADGVDIKSYGYHPIGYVTQALPSDDADGSDYVVDTGADDTDAGW